MNCLCGSGQTFETCCKQFLSITTLGKWHDQKLQYLDPNDSVLISWIHKYSKATPISFYEKVKSYIYRISYYLDEICNLYLLLPFPYLAVDQERADRTVISLKNNILLSLFGANTCLSEGLFIQSGILIRSLFEDCFVLLDLCLNDKQLNNFLRDKYKASSALTRIKAFIPSDLVSWYGYFSANFTHAGPLHKALYMPMACYPDNWVIVTGIQNLVRAVVSFHIVLERAYLKDTESPCFWNVSNESGELLFNEGSKIFKWARILGQQIASDYNPDMKKEGFSYSKESYKLKT